MRAHDAEAGERRSQREAEQLDQHVAALEHARREALSKRLEMEARLADMDSMGGARRRGRSAKGRKRDTSSSIMLGRVTEEDDLR